jgi:regulator of RNase E activity RraA
MAENEGDLTRRLAQLYTGAVADIMDDMGYRNQCLPAEIRPLEPRMKVAGPIYPVRGRAKPPGERPDPRYRQMDMLDAIHPGSVVVIEPGDETRAAHWGELMSNTARQKGAVGCVINGGLRDSLQILEIGFPVFRKFHSPLTAVYRFEITDFGQPIEIGGVAVMPRDYILGDIDGVLVIPRAIAAEVIGIAESVREKETIVRGQLQRGGNIRDLFDKYRVF